MFCESCVSTPLLCMAIVDALCEVQFLFVCFFDALCPPATKGLGSNLHHGDTRWLGPSPRVVESKSRTLGRLRTTVGKGLHKFACRWSQKRCHVSTSELICVAFSVSLVNIPMPSAICIRNQGL